MPRARAALSLSVLALGGRGGALARRSLRKHRTLQTLMRGRHIRARRSESRRPEAVRREDDVERTGRHGWSEEEPKEGCRTRKGARHAVVGHPVEADALPHRGRARAGAARRVPRRRRGDVGSHGPDRGGSGAPRHGRGRGARPHGGGHRGRGGGGCERACDPSPRVPRAARFVRARHLAGCQRGGGRVEGGRARRGAHGVPHGARRERPAPSACCPACWALAFERVLDPVPQERRARGTASCARPAARRRADARPARRALHVGVRPPAARLGRLRPRPVARVVTCTGSAGGLGARVPLAARADCLVCGEVKYHDALDLSQGGPRRRSTWATTRASFRSQAFWPRRCAARACPTSL